MEHLGASLAHLAALLIYLGTPGSVLDSLGQSWGSRGASWFSFLFAVLFRVSLADFGSLSVFFMLISFHGMVFHCGDFGCL
jgi:hypothetical protein